MGKGREKEREIEDESRRGNLWTVESLLFLKGHYRKREREGEGDGEGGERREDDIMRQRKRMSAAGDKRVRRDILRGR